jgi:alpha-1,6-mannosyltransferase
MKTLHITNAWHERSGGIATFYRALLAASLRSGREMVLVVPGESTTVEQVGPGTRIYTLRAPRAPFSPQYRWLLPHRYLAPRGEIRGILRTEQPDLGP